ncbi:MAG: TonB-dependent receptor [Saprospiraceae bacterium]|nr:TonB-dependent receptor [Candidatus Opimibacter skivensis]
MHLFRAGIVLLLLTGPHFSFGQSAGFDSFIDRIAGQYKVDVAIAPELVPTLDSIRNVGSEISSIQELLYRLLNHSGITYQIVDGNKLMLRREDPLDENLTLAVLVGTITDAKTGEPLPYATVVAQKSNTGCNTDENGHFILPLRDTSGNVTMSYLGFKPKTMSVHTVLKGSINVKLEISEVPLKEVIVIVPYRLMGQDYAEQSTDLDGYQFISETQLLTWNAERLLTNLTSYTHFSSDRGIRIRGTDAGNSLIIMDEIPVYDPYHFYNIFSPFNGQYFSSVDVYKNNLPIEYGGRIDGMIDAQSKRETPKSKLILDTDLLQTALTTELKLAPDIYLLAGGRLSHTGILNEALSDSTSSNFRLPGKYNGENEWTTSQAPTSDFYDINLGLVVKPGKESALSFNFFESRDQVDNTTNSDFEIEAQHHELIAVNQTFSSTDIWKNRGISAALETPLDLKTSLHISAFHSMFDKEVNYASLIEQERFGDIQINENSGFQQSNLVSTGVKGFVEYKTDLQTTITGGVDFQKHTVDFNAKENNAPYLTQVQDEVEASTFGEISGNAGHKLNWAIGSRFTYLKSTGNLYALPNLRLHYSINDQYSLRASYSKNLQTVRTLTVEDRFGRELTYLVLSDPEDDYPVLKSDKYMIGAGYSAAFLSLDAELYYKKSDGLARVRPLNPDPSHGNQGSDDFYRLFTGDGRTYGIDLTLLYKKKKVEASVLYTLSKIEERYAMLFNGSYFTPQDDRRHQLKASGTYSFGKFRASTLITYKSKAPYLSLVRLDGRNGIGMEDFNAVQRYLPSYFSLDLGLDFSFLLFKQPAMIGVSLINATNNQNISDLQHLGKISRGGDNEVYITSQTEFLGRTANVHFRYLIN